VTTSRPTPAVQPIVGWQGVTHLQRLRQQEMLEKRGGSNSAATAC